MEVDFGLWQNPGLSAERGLNLLGHFDYGGRGQGFGLIVNADFIKKFIIVCGREKLEDTHGTVLKVTHTSYSIEKLENPWLKLEFDINQWREDLQLINEDYGHNLFAEYGNHYWQNYGDSIIYYDVIFPASIQHELNGKAFDKVTVYPSKSYLEVDGKKYKLEPKLS